MDPLEDAQEFGRLVGAARGYARMKKPAFARAAGSSVPTVTRWENGEVGSIGRTVAERRQLAERVIEATGCPAWWFGIEAGPSGLESRLDGVEDLVEGLREVLVDLATRAGVESAHDAIDAAIERTRNERHGARVRSARTGSARDRRQG